MGWTHGWTEAFTSHTVRQFHAPSPNFSFIYEKFTTVSRALSGHWSKHDGIISMKALQWRLQRRCVRAAVVAVHSYLSARTTRSCSSLWKPLEADPGEGSVRLTRLPSVHYCRSIVTVVSLLVASRSTPIKDPGLSRLGPAVRREGRAGSEEYMLYRSRVMLQYKTRAGAQ